MRDRRETNSLKKIGEGVSSAALIILVFASCYSKDKSPAPTSAVKPDQAIPQEAAANQPGAQETAAASVTYTPTEAISAARNLLKAGNVDEAAAKLAQLRIQGATFNAQQAKDYRQALSEAYDRAIEAAQRGDPKAQTAIQLLRAAAPR